MNSLPASRRDGALSGRSLYCMLLVAVVLLAWSVGVAQSRPRLSAVTLTVSKDLRVFEKSILSAVQHMHEIDRFYVITPHVEELEKKLSHVLPKKVQFVSEKLFPFHEGNVSSYMIEAVKEKGVYPLTGRSPFEKTAWGKSTWFLQQLLKFYAGRILGLEDFVLLDSDVIWFRNITFVNESISNELVRYNYVSSSQYHPPYMATLPRIAGVGLYPAPKVFRSGICHHMVISKVVLDNMTATSEALHDGLPFWKVLLNVSALEMTCRAPREGICGAGSTLSEYELYFNYARMVFPQTVALRPLMWANGPMPGLQYWPDISKGKISSDRHRFNWLGHSQNDIPGAFKEQVEGDGLQGFDYVAYHAYAKRRYYELVGPDVIELCRGVAPPFNTTCSWRGFPERLNKSRTAADWFQGCACYFFDNWE